MSSDQSTDEGPKNAIYEFYQFGADLVEAFQGNSTPVVPVSSAQFMSIYAVFLLMVIFYMRT